MQLKDLIVLCSPLALVTLFCSCQSSDQDEQTIRTLMVVGLPAAWEKNDTTWLKNNYLPDADVAFPAGPLYSGVENIPLSGGEVPEGRKFSVEIQDVRFISPEVALVNNRAHFSGGNDAVGQPIPDTWDMGTFVLKKTAGQWKIAALRVMPMRTDPLTLKKVLEENYARYVQALQRGDGLNASGLFTADAEYYGSNSQPLLGRTAILNQTNEFFNNYILTDLQFIIHNLYVNGDLIYESGEFRPKTKLKSNQQEINQTGHYQSVWRYEPDQQWRICRHFHNYVQ